MYERGIIHIIMIIAGLVIACVLIGMFSIPPSSRTTQVQTEETQTYYAQ